MRVERFGAEEDVLHAGFGARARGVHYLWTCVSVMPVGAILDSYCGPLPSTIEPPISDDYHYYAPYSVVNTT